MAKKKSLSLFPRRRKKASKKRTPPTLESKRSSKVASELPVYPRNRSSVKRKRKSLVWSFLQRVTLVTGGAVALYGGIVFLTLPDIESLNRFLKTPSILIKSQEGAIIGSFGDVYGDYIYFSELPASLVDAVVATEDRNFFHHFGVDPVGLARATVANIRAGHVVQGGSTVTQQVAKNVFLTPERNLHRKVKEMLLAFKLERRFSKQDIMSIYLNRVYLGAGNYGVDAAARRYFDKSARELTLSESAIMAGLLKAPSRFAPTSNPTLSRKRAEQILVNMQEAGFLTAQQVARARDELTKTMNARKRTSQSAYYFADWILDQLPDYVGNLQQDIVVTTTLKPEWQMLADKAVNDILQKEGEAGHISQGALLAMSPNGAIYAMIGGLNYAESQYNRATQALRQPGSAFKLFVYLSGLEIGMTPSTVVEDKPISIYTPSGYWKPKNYTGKYLGSISLKEAVTQSINTVAVQVAQQAGLRSVVSMAKRLGVESDLDPLPSIALGSTEMSLMELTTAYAHLAADGAIVQPYGILKIETADGQPLYAKESAGVGGALRADVVAMMNDMLISVVERGTGRGASIGRPVAGKTGTTSDYRDAWFIGYTPDVVAGVWVGNDDNSEMKKITGGTVPAQVWRQFMSAALANTPVKNIATEARSPDRLPWQEGNTGGQAGGGEDDVHLGKSFWDKLLR